MDKVPLSWVLIVYLVIGTSTQAGAWFDETHIAIAKAAGYAKWFNANGADLAKLKAGAKESHNHYANNPHNSTVTPQTVLTQIDKYNRIDKSGHLYGAIVGSIRDYIKAFNRGRYPEYHLAFCAHYVGDLSQPLHNIEYNRFNRAHHKAIDGIINADILDHIDRIQVYEIEIQTEPDLIREIARIANLSRRLADELQSENRLLTPAEAYRQIGHSASLFKAILVYIDHLKQSSATD